jgi:hypothetical protein
MSSTIIPSRSATASTTSLLSTRPSTPAFSDKDYSLALGTLQSSYGLNGAPIYVTNVVAPATASHKTKAASPSFNTRSRPKDFEAALSDLQSSYGLVGAPLVVSTSSSKPKPKKAHTTSLWKRIFKSTSSPSYQDISHKEARDGKDFEKAFAKLQSTQGMVGAPIVFETDRVQ